MTNYKITNLKTKAVYFLNEPQKETFFKINTFYDGIKKVYNYRIQNIKDIKNKKIESFLFMVVSVCIMAALYIGLCELLTFIDRITLN